MVGKGKFALIAIAMSLLISVSFAQQSHPLNEIVPKGLPSDTPLPDSHLNVRTWNIVNITQVHTNTILRGDGLGSRTISLLEVGSNLFGLTIGAGSLTCTACIDLVDMATGSVNSDKIVDDSIVAGDIATDGVGAAEIAAGAVGTSEIADLSIVNGDVSDSAGIAWGKLSGYASVTGSGGLTGGGALSSSQSLSIATGGVTSGHIADGAIVDGDVSGSAGIAKSKISTSGTWAVGDIPGLPTSKITSGSFSDSFISSASTWNAKAGTGSCAAGSSIRVIDSTGVTACETDDGSTYSAGSGLSLSETTFSVANNGITSGMVAFNYAGSSSEGGAASSALDLSCSGCVSRTEMSLTQMLVSSNINNGAPIEGHNSNSGGQGVYGNSPGWGVYGVTTGGTGTGVYGQYDGGANSYGVYCNAGSNGLCGGTRSWTSSSDARKKTDVKTITGALDKVEKLRGVSFAWKDTNERDIGFVAQESIDVVPELIDTDMDGYYTMRYDQITALLTEAIKEQQQQIELQNKQIKQLQDQVALLQLQNKR